MSKGEQLADRFEQINNEFISVVENYPDDRWQSKAFDEDRPVNVIAHHVGLSHSQVATMVKTIAEGGQLPPVTWEMIDQGNAAQAAEIAGAEKHETLEQMEQTYQFIKEAPISLVNLYVLTPMPGTPVWHDAKARGLVSDDMDWDRLNISFELGWKDAILVSETVTREELYRMYRKIRRLRLVKFAKAVPSDPLRMDLLNYGKAKVVQWTRRALALPAR